MLESRIIYEDVNELECEILWVEVPPELRNRGVGTKLLNDFLHGLADKNKNLTVFLEVREDNIPALKLYTNAGFEEFSKRATYYDDGCTAVCMKRKVLPK